MTLTLSGYAVADGYSYLSNLPEFQAAIDAEEFQDRIVTPPLSMSPSAEHAEHENLTGLPRLFLPRVIFASGAARDPTPCFPKASRKSRRVEVGGGGRTRHLELRLCRLMQKSD